MRPRRFGSRSAALSTISLALTASAFAANHPAAATPPPPAATRPAATVPPPAHALPAACTSAFTVPQHRRYAKRVFQRTRITRAASRRLSEMRRCQKHRPRGTRAARRTERKLEHRRARYRCTQSKVVNCIRDATRIHGGSFAHNLACAKSESGLNPYARNRGGSGAGGLYQFMPSTWSRTLARMGVKAKSIYSAKWQSRAAAWKFRHDGYGEWTGAGC